MILKNLRIFLSLFLVCSVLIPLTIPQTVLSQTITTVTSVQYSTTSLTTTLYSTSRVNITTARSIDYDVTPYDYSYRTGLFSLWQTVDVPGPRDEDVSCFFYDYFLLNGTAGQEIRGHFDVNMEGRVIDFFILTRDQLRSFFEFNCVYGWDGKSMLHVYSSSYDLDWIVPASGEYALLFLSTAFYGGDIRFTAQAYSTSVQSQTLTATSTEAFTARSSQITVSTLPGTNPLVATTNPYLVALIALIIIGLIVILVRSRMKRQTQ